MNSEPPNQLCKKAKRVKMNCHGKKKNKAYTTKRMKTEACIYKQGMAENILHRLPLNLI